MSGRVHRGPVAWGLLAVGVLAGSWGGGASVAQAAEGAAAPAVPNQVKVMPGPGGGTCTPGGSGSASNCPGWGGYVKPMPGTICTMNVGNGTPNSFYTNKIRNCTEATERRNSIAGDACDVINIIELNSNTQCGCACDPTNTCAVWDPYLPNVCLLDSPSRKAACKTSNNGYYDPARCELCKGCGLNGAPDCLSQAKYFCPASDYETPICFSQGDKGCDCMCVRKSTTCPLQAGHCEHDTFHSPGGLGCDTGNYATCQKCDVDGDGSFDWGSCVAHPPHCNDLSPWDRGQCLDQCSTPIMTQAAQYLANTAIRTISGDMNCGPYGACGVFGACPWIDDLAGYGLQLCGSPSGTTQGGMCAIDMVFSNACGCGDQVNRSGPGDHSGIVFRSLNAAWTGALTEILSASSGTTCPDPDPPTNTTSDLLGAFASCPTTENGQPKGSCASWGVTANAKIRYYARADECLLEAGSSIPKVMVCDMAVASASASCTANASSGAQTHVTAGKAQINTAMACNNGTVTGNPYRRVDKGEVVTPNLVTRSDGNLYFRVERDAHRDREASCNATLPTGPCTATPSVPNSSAASVARKLAMEAVCVGVSDNTVFEE